MPIEKKPTETKMAKAAADLVPLLERKRLLMAQFNWHRNSPQVKEDLKEEITLVCLELDKKYKVIKDYYRR